MAQQQQPARKEVRIKPSKPQYDILVSEKAVNLFLAGQGSGKTHIAGIVSGNLIIKYPKVHGFIGANTYTQLSDSTLFRIRQVWKDVFGWTEYGRANPKGNYVVDVIPPPHFNTAEHNYDSYHGKICFANGQVIYKGSLDNYKAHDGKEFAWAILDETKDTKEEAVKEVILGRLREKGMWTVDGQSWNPLFIFTSPAKVAWINEWFNLEAHSKEIKETIYSETTYFKKVIDNKFVVISSTYHNKANLPSDYIANMKKNLNSSLQSLLIYGDPFSQSGGEFYKMFNRERQIIDVSMVGGFKISESNARPYNPDKVLHLTFDYNVNPYVTANVWQTHERKAYKVNEILMEHPRNTSLAACAEFERQYPTHANGLFVYGDPQGLKQSTADETYVRVHEKDYSEFNKILVKLKRYNPQLKVARAYPSVRGRGDFINTVFENNFMDCHIFFDERCIKSHAEYTNLKENKDGEKLKEKYTNEVTKVECEKWGHISDADDYFLTQYFADEFYIYQHGDVGGQVSVGTGGRSKNKW